MVSVSPKSELFYKTTAYIQNHTLLNRGITTIGGSTVPQCVMSNNKDETRERAIMGGIYFVASYLTPIILLPFYNKHFLAKNGVIKKGDKLHIYYGAADETTALVEMNISDILNLMEDEYE